MVLGLRDEGYAMRSEKGMSIPVHVEHSGEDHLLWRQRTGERRRRGRRRRRRKRRRRMRRGLLEHKYELHKHHPSHFCCSCTTQWNRFTSMHAATSMDAFQTSRLVLS